MNKERERKSGKNKEGFTLTEILVVVLIAAVMAAIAYPMYTKSIMKARAVEAVNLLEIVKTKQASRYIVSRRYYASFENMGQLTQNKSKEKVNAAEPDKMEIGDYTLTLNNAQNCIRATYKKSGKDLFTFSSSYDDSGLGCSGDICRSFGNVIGEAKEVCNCGNKTCNNGYILNEDTCECYCKAGLCDIGGRCYSPSQAQATSTPCSNVNSGYTGGTVTRTCRASCSGGSCGSWNTSGCTKSCTATEPAGIQTCASGCGTQTRTVACNSSTGSWKTGIWTGKCGSKTQTQETSKQCSSISSLYSGGRATRECEADCEGGKCKAWDMSACERECSAESKPEGSESCGKCGRKRRTVECNSATGVWKEGECEKGSANCTETCRCDSGYSWAEDKNTCTKDPVECPADTKPDVQVSCGKCGTQKKKVSCDTTTGKWKEENDGSCVEAEKPETEEACGCKNGGKKRREAQCTEAAGTTNASWSEPDWGECSISDECTCDDTKKPELTRYCGNKCGKESGTAECNSTMGKWKDVVWSGTCSNEGVCTPCTENCNDRCQCQTGFSWTGSECQREEECIEYVDSYEFKVLDDFSYSLPIDNCDGDTYNRYDYTKSRGTKPGGYCQDIFDTSVANSTGIPNCSEHITGNANFGMIIPLMKEVHGITIPNGLYNEIIPELEKIFEVDAPSFLSCSACCGNDKWNGRKGCMVVSHSYPENPPYDNLGVKAILCHKGYR
ncbi:MAG: prepilin-type N-terminal cleavage/methylation domain-containing protein [Elusimicrobiota bacterium]|jgi:type IV pilus assembly protein PilE|nr:prepilin-type N-terminal cleavage/methylation domain-containing protein [Elusimicrobiota bacterium]